MPEPSIIDARLAEIDRRLRTIQTGLKPTEPSPPAPVPLHAAPDLDPEPERDDATEALVDRLGALGEAHERLLELHRELLEQYARVLERTAAQAATASVTAGPFADGAAVDAFERGLATLPGVAAVTVREYLGADRVALEVTLAAR
jgi:hypothetical protein